MNASVIKQIALSVGISALAGGCAGPAVSDGAPTSASTVTHRGGHSWMAPNTSVEDLLYVTGACGGICVFSYPGGALVGELADSNTPSGECVDKTGDVFVVNYQGTPGVYEYAHGGTSPIEMLSDPGYYPQACSIDPTTGNLAVTNTSGQGEVTGGVAIYADAKGDAADYVDPKIFYMGFCAYDDAGNLFVDGQYDHEGTFQFDELPKGSSNFKSIKLSQEPGYPLNMQWTGKYVALADSGTVIYDVAVKGSHGDIIGTTVLNSPGSIIGQFWIQGGRIVSPYATESSPYEVGFWRYPDGGLLRKSIGGSEFYDSQLFGAAVSLAHK